MIKRLGNWTYRQLTGFLWQHGFRFFEELGGSHQRWRKPGIDGEADRLLEIYFTRGTYPRGTMKTTIRKSGIPEKEWFEWANS